jgi:hypothetical protein
MGEREKNVQRQPSHGRVAVQLQSDGDEAHGMLPEHIHEPCQVEQGSAEAIHLVDHPAINAARFDIAPRRKSKERLLGLFFAAFLRHECAELTCICRHAEG